MITYKLTKLAPEITSNFAVELLDGVPTGSFVNTETNETYLAWVAEGNTPEPAENI
jgi:hypothetical protein